MSRLNAVFFQLFQRNRLFLLVYALTTFCLICPSFAYADFSVDVSVGGQNNSIETVFCNIIGLLTGGTGKAIASVGIIATGIGALLGKTSWGAGFIVATGVALIFGASSVVNVLTGNGGASFCSGVGVYISVSIGGDPGVVPSELPGDDDSDPGTVTTTTTLPNG